MYWGNQNKKSTSTYKETGQNILLFYQIVKSLGKIKVKIHLLHNKDYNMGKKERGT